MFVCEYCGRVLKTKGSLATHQKKTKSCFEKRALIPISSGDSSFIESESETIEPTTKYASSSEVVPIREGVNEFEVAELRKKLEECGNALRISLLYARMCLRRSQKYPYDTVKYSAFLPLSHSLDLTDVEKTKQVFANNHFYCLENVDFFIRMVVENILVGDYEIPKYICTSKGDAIFMYRDQNLDIVVDEGAERLILYLTIAGAKKLAYQDKKTCVNKFKDQFVEKLAATLSLM